MGDRIRQTGKPSENLPRREYVKISRTKSSADLTDDGQALTTARPKPSEKPDVYGFLKRLTTDFFKENEEKIAVKIQALSLNEDNAPELQRAKGLQADLKTLSSLKDKDRLSTDEKIFSLQTYEKFAKLTPAQMNELFALDNQKYIESTFSSSDYSNPPIIDEVISDEIEALDILHQDKFESFLSAFYRTDNFSEQHLDSIAQSFRHLENSSDEYRANQDNMSDEYFKKFVALQTKSLENRIIFNICTAYVRAYVGNDAFCTDRETVRSLNSIANNFDCQSAVSEEDRAKALEMIQTHKQKFFEAILKGGEGSPTAGAEQET